ncbi:FAD:protein FMN transferase [Salisediminibacterium beveridgei]|uniref:FAD:protein FMN transferase n=1 Tax=Salisediminibacterium beveridgei TaxID=632773 RepID=A0A1D7QYG6_9BACI|nr:FAD:protein FMN transferase [Salisediminibacterium beveridgei]AOM84018.1 thiamin biosynthesis lipoprotein, ApbE-like protein [Salisediminibacterium beveridgei]
MKKIMAGFTAFVITAGCSAGASESYDDYERHSEHLFDYFDTVVQVIGYTESAEDFYEYVDHVEERYRYFHKLFDYYNEYDDFTNVSTINANAGIEPVTVDDELFEIIAFSKEWHEQTEGKMNIAVGSLVELWTDVMNEAKENPDNVSLPDSAMIEQAQAHTSMDQIILDEEASTVYLEDEQMSLDLGAIAKGFAADIVGTELIEMGFESGVIMSGGNWQILGPPMEENRDYWIVGVQDPDQPHMASEDAVLERIQLQDQSIDTSGDYERYVMIDDKRIHHIIDVETGMPAEHHRGISVVADSAVVTEYLTTELFLLPFEDGLSLVESLENVEALWVGDNKDIRKSSGMEDIIQ